jgi:hypothetical protein
MSQQLINRSPDLKRLRDDGYNVEVRAGHLLVKEVPYVNASREIRRGTLVSTLTLAGDVTDKPDGHVAMFVGDYPCDQNGAALEKIRSGGGAAIDDGLVANYSFSSKPTHGQGYADYYEKMTAYAAILQSHVQAIDPKVTAQTFTVVETGADESVFHYEDTASSRAGINLVSQKLKLSRIAIVGLGGTGSYVLDLTAKTPVGEIHLFDGDQFLSHNAFRAPSAASIEALRAKPSKVAYLHHQYSQLHRSIIPHAYYLDASNAHELEGMEFVFLCIDAGSAKKLIVEKLEELGIPFIDVGMGITLNDESLGGIVQTTLSTSSRRDNFRRRVSLGDPAPGNEYERNIQVADLNALNAALAVIAWKKLYGFYRDYDKALYSSYTIDCNMLLSEDWA